MRKLKVLLSALLLAVTTSAFAQDITVRGVITDASTGEPLSGAAVLVKGTPKGVVADENGHYTVTVPANGTLGFTTIGFKDLEVAVEGRTEINVKLEPDSEALEEVVVARRLRERAERAADNDDPRRLCRRRSPVKRDSHGLRRDVSIVTDEMVDRIHELLCERSRRHGHQARAAGEALSHLTTGSVFRPPDADEGKFCEAAAARKGKCRIDVRLGHAVGGIVRIAQRENEQVAARLRPTRDGRRARRVLKTPTVPAGRIRPDRHQRNVKRLRVVLGPREVASPAPGLIAVLPAEPIITVARPSRGPGGDRRHQNRQLEFQIQQMLLEHQNQDYQE